MPVKTRNKTTATKAGDKNKAKLESISKEVSQIRAWAKWVNHVVDVLKHGGPIGGVGQPPYPS